MTIEVRSGYIPESERLIENPGPKELRELTAKMPNARRTSFDNYNVHTKVDSRSTKSTYIVTDNPEETSGQTVSTEEGRKWAKIQDDYIRNQEMVLVEGFIGNDPKFVTPARLIIEARNANVAGMQRLLYYPMAGTRPQPEITIIDTPNLTAPGYPQDRAIFVDLEAGITRVLNSDYFGESKKGGLRMWNKKVYDAGGLAMHAGCKVIPVGNETRVFLIVGLSGTGKTTTTFTTQNKSKPVQDDFIALMPGGRIYGTENGCFAKTYSLDPKHEPTIYGAVTKPEAYLENVSQKEEGGPVDFYDQSYTQNGRAVFALADLGWVEDARNIGPADVLLILNRNENLIPGVARLDSEHAAAYFMLGETKGTSAGGKDEMGKSLRVPGTNPFFPLRHEQQGNRFLELHKSRPFEVYLMNTGRVGGPDGSSESKKLTIEYSSAIVKAVAEGTIKWVNDPDFGYDVAEEVPGVDDIEVLQPRRLYERTGRGDEYRALVQRLKQERIAELARYPGLDKEITAAVR
ncbi:MAG: phosphoenolpyruvate carboxykinase [Candidatus Dormibacteraeota bacterium]|nr:phosphoenolpyruvate carboxykinase [Candidatus Dormibacteraeota bacterium]